LKLAAEEAKLAEAGAQAEARITKARDAAMANVGSIANDAAAAIVGKLTGRMANATELAAVRAGRG
jgi:F0F1-type ATP synthase membrane subunit b/b'